MMFYKIMKRVVMFKLHDWKHIFILFKSLIINIIKFDFLEAKDSYYFIKLHITHDSVRVK